MTQYPELESYVPIPHQHVLLTDDNRMNSFREAIDSMVKPGNVVLDMSFGTGIYAFFAARKARRVFVLESTPERASLIRRFVSDNGLEGKIEVFCSAPDDFEPPEPVQVVLFEPLQSGLLADQSLARLNDLRRMLARRCNGPYTVVPYLSIHCTQPVEVNFSYFGYQARLPRYQHAYWVDERVTALAEPQIYWVTDFQNLNDASVRGKVAHKITRKGRINAVRLITKNVLTNHAFNGRLIEWFCHYLILPLETELDVAVKDRVNLTVEYKAGGSLNGCRVGLSAQERSPNVVD